MGNGAERCSICAQHRWIVDNAYLSEGPAVALALCKELKISQSAFYRHVKSHLSLITTTSPSGQAAIEWCRAASNLAAAVEQYSIVVEPAKIVDISIRAGIDDVGQFVGLFVTHSGALDDDATMSMCIALGFGLETVEVVGGLSPTRITAVKLHAPEIFVGRKDRRN